MLYLTSLKPYYKQCFDTAPCKTHICMLQQDDLIHAMKLEEIKQCNRIILHLLHDFYMDNFQKMSTETGSIQDVFLRRCTEHVTNRELNRRGWRGYKNSGEDQKPHG